MRIQNLLLTLAVTFAAGGVFAAPIEFDTDTAHVIVVRPIDAWNGNRSESEDSLSLLKRKELAYSLLTEGTGYAGTPGFLKSFDPHPVTIALEKQFTDSGYSFTKGKQFAFYVQDAVGISIENAPKLLQAQKGLYSAAVIKQGDPKTLEGRISRGKFFGGALGFIATAVSMDKIGLVSGLNFAEGLGIRDGIYDAFTQYKSLVIPVDIPEQDFAKYDHIEFRKIIRTGSAGQIIIGYKVPKTVEIEREILIKALPIAFGFDTTPEEVEKSRAADYANRVAIWDACVASGKCKGD